jgi:hypothetical protein
LAGSEIRSVASESPGGAGCEGNIGEALKLLKLEPVGLCTFQRQHAVAGAVFHGA